MNAFGRSMSKFVNYKKRSITLPPGCKDLIDLLQQHRQPKTDSTISSVGCPTVTRDESGTVMVCEIAKYVAMPFESAALSSILTLSAPDEHLTVDFSQMEGSLFHASAVFEENADRERLMREFFISQGLQTPDTDWTPTHFVAGVPVQIIFRILPLPSDAATAAQLAVALFRRVCGLTDYSELKFHYCEMAYSA